MVTKEEREERKLKCAEKRELEESRTVVGTGYELMYPSEEFSV